MKSNTFIDGSKIPTEVEEFANTNIIEVEVGTNGYQGDNGGCKTYFRIKDLSNTDMRLDFEPMDSGNHVGEVTITLGGDGELRTFIDALRYALNALEAKANRHSSSLRLSDDEVGVLLQVLQKVIYKNDKNLFGSVCQDIKKKLEGRYEL